MGKQKKIIISVAIIGAIHTPGMSPYLPKTPDEIIEQAVEAHKEGAEGMTTQERFAIIEEFSARNGVVECRFYEFCFNRLAKLWITLNMTGNFLSWKEPMIMFLKIPFLICNIVWRQ